MHLGVRPIPGLGSTWFEIQVSIGFRIKVKNSSRIRGKMGLGFRTIEGSTKIEFKVQKGLSMVKSTMPDG
ncbi:unnamed protein product [Dovyalis caffra]|uniref:Uncharacterized protein n=1 Tax=Dovyalis caffra TaxID=77055 RepID=A0AAV1RSN4_9ROSI|nr:unnamed protein product [Dovyalis caffra]